MNFVRYCTGLIRFGDRMLTQTKGCFYSVFQSFKQNITVLAYGFYTCLTVQNCRISWIIRLPFQVQPLVYRVTRKLVTRQHSSRVHTARLPTVCVSIEQG